MHGPDCTYLDGTEDPKDQGLDDDERRGADAECKVDPNILADIWVLAFLAVDFGPLLKPNATPCGLSASKTCSTAEVFRQMFRGPGKESKEKQTRDRGSIPICAVCPPINMIP
jgi:hypothetical protein